MQDVFTCPSTMDASRLKIIFRSVDSDSESTFEIKKLRLHFLRQCNRNLRKSRQKNWDYFLRHISEKKCNFPHMGLYVYVSSCICLYAYVCAWMSLWACMCMYVHMLVCACMYNYVYVCVYVCIGGQARFFHLFSLFIFPLSGLGFRVRV